MKIFYGIMFLNLVFLSSCGDEEPMTYMANDKVTGSFLTSMTIGQPSEGNSIDQAFLIPGTYTLQFSFIDIVSPFIPDARAIINWKIDGQQQRRVISIVSGAVISAVCNAVDVKIKDVPIDEVFSLTNTYKVQTTLSRGIRANIQQPPILLDEGIKQFSTGAPATFTVPTDSGVISIFPQIGNANFGPPILSPFDVIITFLLGGGALGCYFPLVSPGWTPLPPGTQTVRVDSNVANTNPTFATMLWGIEG